MEAGKRNALQLTRRALLRIGGVNVVGGFLGAFAPRAVRAAEKVELLGTARQVLFVNIEGGMSQDETLIVAMSEFGRTPGPISATRQGGVPAKRVRHFIHAHSGLFAGGGVRRGAVIGRTDELGARIVDPGWSGNRPIYMEDVACTLYSALGIDWRKTIQNTPSGRGFHYVEPASGTAYVRFQPVRELFG